MIAPKFKMGQKVYFALGGDDSTGIITGITQRPDGYSYYVTWVDRHETSHFAIELSETPVREFET